MKGTIRPRGKRFTARYYDRKTKKEIFKTLPTYKAAETFLSHCVVAEDEGSFDARIYQKDNPLVFQKQVVKYLDTKTKNKDIRHLHDHFGKAISFFGGQTNAKEISFAELDDWRIDLEKKELSGKTIFNHFKSLRAFFNWFYKRERGRGYTLPDFPVIKFELGWRKPTTKEIQEAIIDEVKRISSHNPRIWFGIQTLAYFPRLRPGELISIVEGNIDRKTGEVVLRREDTKEGKEKRVYLLEEDLEFIRTLPAAMPTLHFFRHRDGKGFGEDLLSKWWNRACENLGIEGITLYPGTKHTSVTEVRKHLSPEETKLYVTGHTSNEFNRYLIVDADTQREASALIRAKSPARMLHVSNRQRKSGKILESKGSRK